jgi:hypothetical protein
MNTMIAFAMDLFRLAMIACLYVFHNNVTTTFMTTHFFRDGLPTFASFVSVGTPTSLRLAKEGLLGGGTGIATVGRVILPFPLGGTP